MSEKPSVSLLRYHWPLLRQLPLALWQPRQDNALLPEPLECRLPPPPAPLIAAYRQFCDITPQQYPGQLPPHMFCQFALPLLFRQLRQTALPLSRMVNQGVQMRLVAPLETTEMTLQLAVSQITERPHATRLSQTLTISQAQQVRLEVICFTRFVFARRNKKSRSGPQKPDGDCIGQWQADANDGRHFALISGDINPIHWHDWLARRGPFGHKVLQGYASMARTFELLHRFYGQPARYFSVHFMAPVPLPGPPLRLYLQAAESHGNQTFGLYDETHKCYLRGQYQ